MKVKQFFRFTVTALLVMGFFACSSDDDNNLPDPSNKASITGIDAKYTTNRYQVLSLQPRLEGFESTTFQWRVSNTELGIKDSLLTTNQDLAFIESRTGNYELSFSALLSPDSLISVKTNVVVTKETSTYSAYIAKVFDFLPAVGQFTNELPVYKTGDTRETMIQKAEDALKGEKPSMVSLGGFGGYVVFGFDHTIMNVAGKRDFRVLGNAFWAASNPNASASARGGSCEPGVIMVAYDKNKNGQPDDDEWYEIAGSEHAKNKVKYNYEITYYKPEVEQAGALTNYIRWTDNLGNSGYKAKNAFHAQSYFPAWINEDKITYKGTLLPDNAVDESGTGSYWVLYSFDYGYADNAPNNDDASAIDIDWAIDSTGNKVKLPGIDFVKVYTGINQEAGWLGEVSTEVAGAYDLHLLGISISNN